MVGDGTNEHWHKPILVWLWTRVHKLRRQYGWFRLWSDQTACCSGKQQLITRGALTTFSLANLNTLPSCLHCSLLRFHKFECDALSKSKQRNFICINAIIIPLLIPIALRGVKFKLQLSYYVEICWFMGWAVSIHCHQSDWCCDCSIIWFGVWNENLCTKFRSKFGSEASFGLLIFTLVGCGAVYTVQVQDKCYSTIKQMVVWRP